MTKLYPVGLVGERNYQGQISECWEGQPVYICHEPDNPYDALALKVETAERICIGYIPRKSWLRDAIHDEGRGVASTIASISDGGGVGLLGVVIHVTLTDDDVRERSYMPPSVVETPEPTGFLRRLFSR